MTGFIDLPPDSSRSPGYWSRSRIVFLSISGVLLLALLVWAREVLLPFVLALILAYVLTPLVAYCERRKMPRAAAILLVYAVTLSGVYLVFAAIAPRIYQEAVKVSREAPAMASQLAIRWAPVVEERLQGIFGRRAAEPEPAGPPPPALQIEPGADGNFRVFLGTGVDIVQEGPARWRVVGHREPPSGLDVSRLLNQGFEQTIKYIKGNALELLRVGQMVVSQVTRGIFLTFMVLMVAGYVMYTRDDIIGFFRSLPPPGSRRSFDALLARMDRGLSGVVRGQLLICLVNGVLTAIGFALFELKYWPLLSILAGVMSIIPIFGAILSSIPAVMIGLTQDFWTALWVLLWIIGIHQVEANLLNPKIIGTAAKLHPVLVVFALLLGEHSYGLWGALLAVPALSLAQSLFNHFRFDSLPDTPPDSLVPRPPIQPPL